MTPTAEFNAWRANGFIAAGLHLALSCAVAYAAFVFPAAPSVAMAGLLTLGGLLVLIAFSGYLVLQPNEASALVFFGRYVGTVREEGFSWAMPLTTKRPVSLRVRNLTSDTIKVNDAKGNPIEIAAVVVWRVSDTAKALLDVDDYAAFADVQVETALRGLASEYAYDAHDSGEFSLLGSPVEVAATLGKELGDRLEMAGVTVVECRLTHLAYSPEIAQAMLRRQQADAIIAARQKIVEGAVGMVHMALDQLEAGGVVTLDEERKAAMVNNLLVVLTSEQEIQPVLAAQGSA